MQQQPPNNLSDNESLLSKVLCLTISREGAIINSFTVNQLTREGRVETAIAAKAALLCGAMFMTLVDTRVNPFIPITVLLPRHIHDPRGEGRAR